MAFSTPPNNQQKLLESVRGKLEEIKKVRSAEHGMELFGELYKQFSMLDILLIHNRELPNDWQR